MLLKLTGHEAYRNYTTAPGSGWPAPATDPYRIWPLASPIEAPGFRIEPDDRIFTIGSCFARNVERHLKSLGMVLPATELTLPPEEWSSVEEPNGFLNKYYTPSIVQEIRWANDPDFPFPEDRAFVEIGRGRFVDMFMHSDIHPAAIERLRERRRFLSEIYRRIRDCRIVIITLGVAEAWYDRETGLYVNNIPHKRFFLKHRDRFEVHVLDAADTLADLERIHGLLRRFGHPDFRIVITVSPIALQATFTGRDCMVANMFSKSSLRVAADQFAALHDNVDYFASYESVSLTDRVRGYQGDFIHPTDAVVRRNILRLADYYMRPADAPFDGPARLAAALETAEDPASPPADAGSQEQQVRQFLANAFHVAGVEALNKGERHDALVFFRKATDLAPDNASFQVHLGILLQVMGDLDGAEDTLTRVLCLIGAGREAAPELADEARHRLEQTWDMRRLRDGWHRGPVSYPEAGPEAGPAADHGPDAPFVRDPFG